MSEAKTVNPLVAKLIAERDRHVIGYPGPRRDVAELLDKAAAALVSGAEQELVGRSGDAQDIANRLRRFFNQPGDARRLALDAAMMIEYLNKPSPPTSELEALRKRVAELEKALEPFADEAAELADIIDDEVAYSIPGFEDLGLSNFTVGDLRTARRVREGGKVDG